MAAVAATLALGVTGAACGSSSSSSPSTTSAPASTTPKGFAVSTPAGQVSVSLDGKLPPNWPSSFPIPSGAKPAGSGSLDGSSSTRLIAVYSSTAAPGDLIDFYTSDTALTTTKRSSIGAGAAAIETVEITAPYTARLTAVSRGTTTYLLIDLTQAAGGQ